MSGRRVRGTGLKDKRFAVPRPNLGSAQVEWIKQQVAGYISLQRETFRGRAIPLDAGQRKAMQPFFPASNLDSVRVLVLQGERVGNPAFYEQLVPMGFALADLPNFSLMAAITLVDTVVSHEKFTDRLLFRELVHTVQYQKLGLEGFAAKYVDGFLTGDCYEAILLEKNAYELDERFSAQPTRRFSVADEVQKWIDAGRF